LLGAAEPRKLRVQRRDGLGRSLGQGMEDNSGVWLRLGLRLQARTPVAGLSFAAVTDDYGEALIWETHWALQSFQEERVTPGPCGYDEALG